MYETAASIGAVSSSSLTNGRRAQQDLDDSYSQLAIKHVQCGNLLQSVTNTPDPNRYAFQLIPSHSSI